MTTFATLLTLAMTGQLMTQSMTPKAEDLIARYGLKADELQALIVCGKANRWDATNPVKQSPVHEHRHNDNRNHRASHIRPAF